jgi:hypothetical protein
MLTVVVLVLYDPPLPLVAEHEIESKPHPAGMGVSLTVYVASARMLPKSLVFAEVPSSTSEKFVSGEGDPVNAKLVDPSGVACLMIVIEAGKKTAPAESERSWLPPLPSRSTSRV